MQHRAARRFNPAWFAWSPSGSSFWLSVIAVELATLSLGVNQSVDGCVNGCPWQPVQTVPHCLPEGSWESDPVKGKVGADQWMGG